MYDSISRSGEESMVFKTTCLVTLHGIGYQQPPKVDEHGVEVGCNTGYADPLHQHLHTNTKNGLMLSDDPCRSRDCSGDNGVIYVQSRWLDEQNRANAEEGLKSLGTWDDENKKGI